MSAFKFLIALLIAVCLVTLIIQNARLLQGIHNESAHINNRFGNRRIQTNQDTSFFFKCEEFISKLHWFEISVLCLAFANLSLCFILIIFYAAEALFGYKPPRENEYWLNPDAYETYPMMETGLSAQTCEMGDELFATDV